MELHTFSGSDFDHICRTCLLNVGETPLTEIFDEAAMSVREVFQSCVNIQVNDDSLPQSMCSACVQELFRTHQFITKCKRSDAILHSMENMYGINLPLIEISGEKDKDLQGEVEIEVDKTADGSADQNPAVVDTKNSNRRLKARSNKIVARKCMIRSRKYKQLVNHVDKMSDRTCSICSKVFRAPFLLKQHMRSHTNERPYRCDMCTGSFTNSSNLRRHLRIHTGEKPHVCDICNKAYTQATTLLEHKRTHTGEKPYVCCYCGKTFRSYSNHKIHLQQHHIEDDSQNEYDDGETKARLRDLVCKQCGRMLSTKGALKTHMLIHGEKSFLCSNCGKRFVTKVAYLNHYRTHTGEKPFKCDRCDKTFALQASLKQHILIHTGEKPYRCKLCSKGFVQYHQLKYHLRTHSGERPYICSFCGKAFALNGNLTVHKRIHTGETPYHCPVCDKGFYDSSSMKKHRKGHEKDATTLVTSKA